MNKSLKDILIIEDDVSMASTISKIIEKETGFSTHIATGGSEGIQKAFTLIPDMVLCDIRMKDIDGYKVVQILRESSLTSTIPIIFISGKSQITDIKLGMQLGVDDYVTKPFLNKELIMAINNRMKKYEQIIQRTNKNFQTLLELSQIPLFTHLEKKFLHTNQAFCNLLGYSHEEIADKSIYDLIADEQREELSEKFMACLQNIANIKQYTVSLINRSGKYISVTLQCQSGTYINGKPLIIATATEQKKKRSMTLSEIEKSIATIAQNFHVSETISETLIAELRAIYSGDEAQEKSGLGLSVREKEVLEYTCKGLSIKQIADEMNISSRTVEKHRTHLMEKTQSRNVVEVIIYAIKHEIINI